MKLLIRLTLTLTSAEGRAIGFLSSMTHNRIYDTKWTMNFKASKHTNSLVITTIFILHVLGNLHDFVIMSLLWSVLSIFMVQVITWDFSHEAYKKTV